MLIMVDLFTCGVASILQAVGVWKIGVRLPLLQGITFAGLAPIIAIANDHGGGREGLLYVFGAVIVAGAVTFLIAPFFSKLIRFFPPVVTGTIITIIGVALLPVGIGDAVTNPHTHVHEPSNARWMLYALGTILVIVLLQRFLRGFLGTIAVLLGLVAGTVVAWILGDTSFGGVGEAGWVGFVPPFNFGWPQFSIGAIIAMIIVMLIIAVESTGSVFAVGEVVGKRIKQEDIAATVRADGVATVIGGSFNSFPYTAFSENVGLVRLTGVKSRWVVAAAGVIMIILGLFPKAARVVESIPAPVLGGAAMTLFATVAVVGIQTLSKVDFTDHRNLIIVSTSLALGLYVEHSQGGANTYSQAVVENADGTVLANGEQVTVTAPGIADAVPGFLQIPFGTGIVMGALTALVLNILFFHVGGRGQAVAGGGSIRPEDVNNMSREEFAAAFGDVVNNVDWVINRAYDAKPFADAHDLRSAFQESLLAGTEEEQLALINSFPTLGAEDEAGNLTAVDHVALAHLDEEEHAGVITLAETYRDHFGFPLVICAREADRFDRVLANGWSRMENPSDAERSFAMVEIAKITNYRFNDLVADANPITTSLVNSSTP